MKSLYHYVYFHLYDFVLSVRKVNARESAVLYLTVMVFFITLPLFVFIFDQLFYKGMNKVIFMTSGFVYSLLIYYLNKRYFENSRRWKQIISKYSIGDSKKRKIGHIVVIVFFFASIATGFSLLFYL